MIPLIDLKDHLRVMHTDEDAYIAGLEKAAVAAIESWTQRHFGSSEAVNDEVYSGEGEDVIWLTEQVDPADAALVVETWNGTAWVVTAEADYETDGFALYHKASVWPVGRRNVRVTYSRGYAPGDEPWGIRQAVLLLVGQWYQNREAVTPGSFLTQEQPNAVRALIGPYRRLRV